MLKRFHGVYSGLRGAACSAPRLTGVVSAVFEHPAVPGKTLFLLMKLIIFVTFRQDLMQLSGSAP
jgi:hypothetical protein